METRATVATKAEPEPKPKQVVKRAAELLREGELLLKKKHKALFKLLGPEAGDKAVAEVTGQLAATRALVPTRKNPVELEPKRLHQQVIQLDQAIQTHLGKWRKSQLREFVEAILWALGLAAVIKFFILEAFSIPSSSMYPTLQIGDHLFINKFELGLYVPFSSQRAIEWGQPDRGDVIVFVYKYPGDPLDGEDFIKRVVALPGDRIRLEDDRIILNGQPIQTEIVAETRCGMFGRDWESTPSSYCPCVIQRETIEDESWESRPLLPGCGRREEWSGTWPQRERPMTLGKYFGDQAKNPDWPDVVVPDDHVFVMGDNRDASEDGRFWGFVPFDRIKGKAFIVFWPFSRGFDWID